MEREAHKRDDGTVSAAAAGAAPARDARRTLSLAVLLAFAAALCFALAPDSATAEATPARLLLRSTNFAPAAQGGDPSRFSHARPEHARVNCDSCHRREGDSPRPTLPGHRSCTACHFQEFTTSGTPFCASCHTNVASRNPPVKAFPALQSFNVRFDHAQHTSGAGRTAEGCASCHQPARRAAALSIPAGLDAHTNCYQCHSPGASAARLSSCGVCHAPGQHARTPTDARAFRVGFSHSTHGARQGLSCASCHNVRPGAPRARQVTSPQPTQHFGSSRAQTCLTCHDNRRAFGGDDFADCKRCHKGATFRF